MAGQSDTQRHLHMARVAYDSVEDFIQAFVDDELIIYEDSGSLFTPERLIAGGTGLRCRFNPSIGDGITDIFRPFPGILILIVQSERHDTEARNRLIAEQANSMDQFFYTILVDRGSIKLKFGSVIHEIEEGGGLFYTYRSPKLERAFDKIGDGSRFVHIFMTQNGIVNASGRLGIPIPKIVNVLKRDLPQKDSFFPLRSSPATKAFIKSIINSPVVDRVRSSFLRAKFGELLCHISSSTETDLSNEDGVHYFEVTRLARAKQYLDENISGKFDVTELAKHVGLNRSRLSTGFKSRYGMSIRDYRLELRLGKAYVLLSQTTMNIEEISVRCGYQKVGNFSRAFKRRFGSSPSHIRKF